MTTRSLGLHVAGSLSTAAAPVRRQAGSYRCGSLVDGFGLTTCARQPASARHPQRASKPRHTPVGASLLAKLSTAALPCSANAALPLSDTAALPRPAAAAAPIRRQAGSYRCASLTDGFGLTTSARQPAPARRLQHAPEPRHTPVGASLLAKLSTATLQASAIAALPLSATASLPCSATAAAPIRRQVGSYRCASLADGFGSTTFTRIHPRQPEAHR